MAFGMRGFSILRLLVIVVIGGGCMAGAAWYRHSQRRPEAPEAVQAEGRALVRSVLAQVAETEFGKSKRGILLAETVEDLIQRGRLIFTTKRDAQAVYCLEWGGRETLYVRVMRHSRKYKHLDRDDIAEGVFHEAVHAIEGGESASIDEECDGFVAGICAGAAVTGEALPEILRLTGLPVGEFVVRGYPELERNTAYVPVGQTQEWLKERTGLGWVTYPYFREKPGRLKE